MRLTPWLCALLLGSVWHPVPMLACRYNVRDVGFVDLGMEPYELYCFVREATPPENLAWLRELPTARLRDCPVRAELVDGDRQPEHPALKHRPHLASADSSVVLVSPDGQALPFSLTEPGRPFRDTLSEVLDTIATSPARTALSKAAAEAFGVVLLVESDSSDKNTRARQAITDAIAEITGQMKAMPKAIAKPPVLHTLARSAFEQEKVLLWSLGLGTNEAGGPHAAVIYGRSRWIGPLMKDQEITSRNLTRILSFIGADCECGLDIAWTLGTRLPVRWDEGLQTQLVKSLGFDPESPLVKLEVGRIVARGGATRPAGAVADAAVGQPQPAPAPNAPITNHVAARSPDAKPHLGTLPAARALAESLPRWQQPRYVVGTLAVAILGAGWFILRRANLGR